MNDNTVDTNSIEYQKYVLDYTINSIKEDFNLKTKKEAQQLFYKALAYNLVQSEINQQINFIIEGGK